ncbi:MAG TPA: serine hydrolase [Thermomicrobiales bacterium]|jgi:beta-lactamase class A
MDDTPSDDLLRLLPVRTSRRRLLGVAAAWGLAPGRIAAQGTPTAVPSPRAVALPDTPVGRQLGWVLGVLNGGAAALTVADVQQHFGPAFLAAVPADQLIATLRAIAGEAAPVRLVGFAGQPTATQAVALVESGVMPGTFSVSIAVDPTPPYLIEGLLLQPVAASPGTPVAVANWDDLDRQASALAATAVVAAAELVDGRSQPIHARDAAAPIALGSSFKLYVLGELAHQIAAGTAAWDEPLAIRDDWKSLPSGDMRNVPAGTTFPLQHYAEQMIAVSDNTAADHLLFRLGRENVEAFQATMGNSHAGRNVPFLSTRELFVLKLALPSDRVDAYLAADTAERRQLLAEEIDPTPVTLDQAAGWTSPRAIDTLEWFASGEDLGRALAALQEMAAQPGLAPVGHALAINPGVPLDAATWPYVGYKGGSEPGVLTLNWLLQRADGRWFVVSLGWNDPAKAIDEATAVALAGQAIAQVAAAP